MLEQIKLKISSLRLKEIFLMTGFSFIGALFSSVSLFEQPFKLLFLVCFVSLFVLNIYFLNFYADYKEDTKSEQSNKVPQFKRSFYLYAFLCSSILLWLAAFLFHSSLVIYYSAAILLWSTYYLPPLRLKSSLFLGTLIHLIAGVFHFHIGFGVFDSLNSYSFSVGLYFALLLSIGHVNHEALDYEDDLKTGIKTTTVRVGLKKNLLLQKVLLLLTVAYWSIIYFLNSISNLEYYLFVFPLLVLFLFVSLRKEPSPVVFQKISRSLFLIAGTLFFLISLFNKISI